jgi:uncharacterized protein YhaN
MRFTALSLEKYGAFEKRELTFGQDAGLSVIFGPNEAGKSTLLAAVSDFLFGIHPRSSFGSVYGYNVMQIGAALLLEDGTELTLRRRKGSGVTLSDGAGRGVDDSTLARVLGGTGRERFETLFGLNHETLREGGNRLLAADGEIGRLIVEAGGGLRTLVDRLAKLDARIDSLFAKRRSGDRAFYKAFDAVEAADAAIKSGQLTREAFARAEAELATAEKAYEAVRAQGRDLASQKASIERLRRVAPMIRTLGRDEEALATFEDLPRLPYDFKPLVDDAIKKESAARTTASDTAKRYQDLKSDLDAIEVDDRWSILKSKVEEAGQKAVIVQKARGDRPNRLKEQSESEGRLAGIRQLIGASDVEELERRAPTEAVLDELWQLRSDATTRRGLSGAKRERLAELSTDIDVLEKLIDTAKQSGFHIALGIDASDFASLARDASRLRNKRKEIEGKNAKLEARAKALGVESVAALELLPVPDLDSIQALVATLTSHRTQRDREAEKARDANKALKAAEREIERLQQSGEVPTETAITQARVDRETALAPIRHVHLEGRYAGNREVREREVGDLDQAIAKADGLVDRRSAESQRIAALEQQQKLYEENGAEKVRTEAEVTRLDKVIETEQQVFSARYPEATTLNSDIERLKGFVEARQKLLGEFNQADRDRATLDGEQADLDVRLTSLSHAEAKCGLVTGSDDQLSARADAVAERVKSHDTAHGDYVRDLRDAEKKGAEKTRIEGEVAALEKDERGWLEKWTPAIAAIGLEPGASLERAESVIVAWRTALVEFVNLDLIRRRLSRIDEDERNLGDLIGELKSELELPLHEDPVVAASQIQKLASDNMSAKTRREGLEPQVADAAEALRQADLAVTAATGALAELRSQATAADNDQLERIATRSSERDALAKAIADARTSISMAGDGLSVAELTAEWAERDTDSLAAELAAVSADQVKQEEELRTAVEASREAKLALADFDAAKGIEQALAAREGAATDLRNVVEEWLELSLARELLDDAIASVRTEQQDPLIRRSGELFRGTTRGSFGGVATDVDTKGLPVVVGVRPDESRASVSELSDGTRDQLFLSFRLASLERYAEVAEPLPFVADDILVHFDDERAEATLELLATFGEKNQVLLFTHHASVRDAAKRVSERANVEVLELMT